jgi:hypothetical protein
MSTVYTYLSHWVNMFYVVWYVNKCFAKYIYNLNIAGIKTHSGLWAMLLQMAKLSYHHVVCMPVVNSWNLTRVVQVLQSTYTIM